MVNQPSSRATRRVIAIASAISVAVVLSGCGSSIQTGGDDAASGPLKVGVIVPATGPLSSAGLALQNGFEIAVDRINEEGGVDGQDIEFTVEDDRSDPATSTQIAKRYVQDPATSLVFGTITGDTAAAVTSVIDEAEIPFATAILGDPSRCSPYRWAFGESVRQMLRPMVPTLLEEYGPRVAIVGSDYVFPHEYAAEARKIVEAEGGTVVAEEYSPLGTADFESTIGRLKDADPDVVLSMVVGADAITFTKQASDFGLLTPQIGFDGAPTDADYYPAVASIVDGRSKLVRWTDAFTDEESIEFVKAYRDATGSEDPVPEVAANAYFAMRFIAAAANEAGTTEPTALNDAIGAFEYDSPLGDGTHFAGEAQVLQADMFTAQIEPGGVYRIVEDHGLVEDVDAPCE